MTLRLALKGRGNLIKISIPDIVLRRAQLIRELTHEMIIGTGRMRPELIYKIAYLGRGCTLPVISEFTTRIRVFFLYVCLSVCLDGWMGGWVGVRTYMYACIVCWQV